MMGWIAAAGAGAFAYYAMRYLMEPVQESVAAALEKAGQRLEVDAQGVVTVAKACESIVRLGQMWRDAEGSVLGLRRAVARMEAAVARAEKDERAAKEGAAVDRAKARDAEAIVATQAVRLTGLEERIKYLEQKRRPR
jgi:hypothetical protein